SASALVYSTLQFFTLGLVVHSLLEIVARSFYADKDTLTPFWAALGGATINLILSILLSGVLAVSSTQTMLFELSENLHLNFILTHFSGDQGNVGGLALANSLGTGFEVLVLLWILRRRWHGVREKELSRTLAKTLAASLVMGLAVVVASAVWSALGLTGRGLLWTVVQLGVEVGAGAVAFAAAAALLRMQELRAILDMVLRRRTFTEAAA
ncbi:MAG: polysaccharide biosynthesis C-terminal domain-containing protein, partial [Anaerolineae bacterium]|nr:polysaccharide biosynthesis C-terminal domain-containing protein [Anaerolineae bacterium]